MIYQRFSPEGWEKSFKPITKEYLNDAMQTGNIVEGRVEKCDSDYNLYVNFGNNVTGIIPREEIEAINTDELGLPKANICKSKVNQYVQFKVKGVDEKDKYILSRKEVEKEALKWVENELQEGETVSRNCKRHKAIWSVC